MHLPLAKNILFGVLNKHISVKLSKKGKVMKIYALQTNNYKSIAMRNNSLQKVNSQPNFKGGINHSIEHYDKLGKRLRNIAEEETPIKEKLKDLKFELEITRDNKARKILEEQIEDLELDLDIINDRAFAVADEREKICDINGWD